MNVIGRDGREREEELWWRETNFRQGSQILSIVRKLNVER